MAKYKRQKVKHYHRSFYSREMRVKRGIGIAVLVVAVLAAAWFAAPHVLDWATHTWYTVVKDRDLEAESASRAEAAASSAAASSAAASQAASSEPEPEEEKPLDGKAITGGSWAELDVTALTDDAAIRAAARQLKQQGADYALVTLKDAAGTVYYASGVAAAAQSITENPVDAASIAAILREEGIIPAAQLAALGTTGTSLGMENLLVTSSTELDADSRAALEQAAADAGVQHLVVHDTAAFR